MKLRQMIFAVAILLQSLSAFGKIDNFSEVVAQSEADLISATKQYRKFIMSQLPPVEAPTPSQLHEAVAQIEPLVGQSSVNVSLYQLPEDSL